jgi:hypothetical protein
MKHEMHFVTCIRDSANERLGKTTRLVVGRCGTLRSLLPGKRSVKRLSLATQSSICVLT